MQTNCAVALGASSAVYLALALPDEWLLPCLYRPELVLRSVSDVVASLVSALNLSLLGGRTPWQASPAAVWAMLSTGLSAAAAADPYAHEIQRLVMIGLSCSCAVLAGRRANELIQSAVSEEDRYRSRIACHAIAVSWVVNPLIQYVAIHHDPSGLLPMIVDLVFKYQITQLLLQSRSSPSARAWQQVASFRCCLIRKKVAPDWQ